MAKTDKHKKAEAAWDRILALGGDGVWERDTVVVSLGNSKVRDADLSLFQDFPFVQILVLSGTKITDDGLAQLGDLPALEEIVLTKTKVSAKAIKEFQRAHPSAKVTTKPPPKSAINPFTGKPF